MNISEVSVGVRSMRVRYWSRKPVEFTDSTTMFSKRRTTPSSTFACFSCQSVSMMPSAGSSRSTFIPTVGQKSLTT